MSETVNILHIFQSFVNLFEGEYLLLHAIADCRSSVYDFNRYEKFLEHSKTTHAMGRVGTADEVGKRLM